MWRPAEKVAVMHQTINSLIFTRPQFYKLFLKTNERFCYITNKYNDMTPTKAIYHYIKSQCYQTVWMKLAFTRQGQSIFRLFLFSQAMTDRLGESTASRGQARSPFLWPAWNSGLYAGCSKNDQEVSQTYLQVIVIHLTFCEISHYRVKLQ